MPTGPGGLGEGGVASSGPEKGGDWGNRKGTKEDVEILGDLIKEALKEGTKGNSKSHMLTNESIMSKVWTSSLQRQSIGISTSSLRIGKRTTTIQVPAKRFLFKDNIIKPDLSLMKVRQWVESWKSHLGKKATPKALVDAIVNKKVGEANNLKDKVETEFNLI